MRYSVHGPKRLEKEYIEYWVAEQWEVNDWYIVDAPTKKKAAWAAFKRAKQNKDPWWTGLDVGYEHPLKGVKVEEYPTPEMLLPWFDEVTNKWHNLDGQEFITNDSRMDAGEKYYINAMI